MHVWGVLAGMLWLLSAVKIELGGGEEEIPRAAPVPAVPFHWSEGVVANPQALDPCRKQCLERNIACRQCLFNEKLPLDSVAHTWCSG